MILQPQVYFPINRQIANHLDVATYYVQAKVYDADGSLISTVNLDDKGSQRFTKKWRTPVDKSGEGTYVSIVTSVYTDASYTTKSSNYGDEENTYLIFNRVKQSGGGGMSGAGGGNVSLSEIKRIMQEVVESQEKPEPIKVPKIPKIPDYTENLAQLDRNFAKIASMIAELPQEQPDMYPFMEGIQNLANAIADKEVTPETDLSEVLQGIDGISSELESRFSEQTQALKDGQEEIVDTIESTINESVSKAKYVNEIVVQPTKQQPKSEEAPQKPFDMRNLVK